jgi:hypothetical protein
LDGLPSEAARCPVVRLRQGFGGLTILRRCAA